MSERSMTPLNPDEALHAFMDGELDLADEQRLFDELASDPTLRQEMKDSMAIREAVHKDLLAPPASVEPGLLAAIGATSGAATAVATAPTTTVASVSGWSAMSYTVGGAVAGFVIAFLLFWSGGDVLQRNGDSLASNQNTNVNGTSAASGSTGNTGGSASQVITGEAPAQIPVKVDTVYAVKYVTKAVPVVEEPRDVAVADDAAATTDASAENVDSRLLPSQTELAVSPVPDHSVALSQRTMSASMSNEPLRSYASVGTYNDPVRFRVRTLASGLGSGEPTPSTISDAILPNTAFALMYPLSRQHYIGVELGSESYKQVFNSTEGFHEVQYTQTPVLFFMGATYEFNPGEIPFLQGLSPFFNTTIGYAMQQGPVGRATFGLAYQPIGPLRLTLGLDGSALMYQFEGSTYTSAKWGLSYGISVDLGAIR